MAEFRASVDIEAPPETVFEYLTTDAGLTAWMGQYADLDPTPGGRFAVDVAGHPVRGEFPVVEHPGRSSSRARATGAGRVPGRRAPRRVVVSWGFAGSDELPAGASTVEFLLTATATGTRVDLHHSDLPDTAVPGHIDGWANFLPRLAVASAGGDAGPEDWRPLTDRAASPHGTAHAVAHESPRGASMTSTTTPHDVVKAYHQAWTNGDVETAMNYVADDISCRAPGIDLEGKDAYRAFIGGFAPSLTGIDGIAEFVDGDRVALFYYPRTAATSTTPAAELFTVEDGRIRESVLIFDRLSYDPSAR